MHYPHVLDGMFTKTLAAELNEIGALEIAHVIEQRSGPVPRLGEITKELMIMLTSAAALGASKAVIGAAKRWASAKRSDREILPRRVRVRYGPTGEVLAEVPEIDL